MKTYLSGWIMTGGIKTDTRYIKLKNTNQRVPFLYVYIYIYKAKLRRTCGLFSVWSEQFGTCPPLKLSGIQGRTRCPAPTEVSLTLLQKEINMKYESFQYCLGLQNKSISHGRQQSNGDSA